MKALSAIICSLLLTASLSARQQSGAPVTRHDSPSFLLPEKVNEAAWDEATFLPARPMPRRDDFIGEQFDVGNTYWDVQANYTVGRLIALDDSGDVHFTWMDGYTEATEGTRHQKYNFFDAGVFAKGFDGDLIAPGDRSGYGCIALTHEDNQRAMVFCHALGIRDVLTSLTCIDWDRGIGAFDYSAMPNYPENFVAWPQGVISPNGKIHIAYDREGGGTLSYTSANFDGNMPVFPDNPIQISKVPFIAYRIASSPVSERAAIIYSQPRHGAPEDTAWSKYFPGQVNNDLMLVTTDDGVNWNFDAPYNVTQCIAPSSEREGDLAYGDTLRPAFSYDVIFDRNDNIHIVFNTYGVWEKPDWEWSGDESDYAWDAFTRDAAMLYHWTEEDSTFAPVAEGWFTQKIFYEEFPDSIRIWPMPEGNRANVCNPSLSYNSNGDLYCVFNYFPYNDYNDYVGRNIVGRCHGDVSVTVSADNGHSWYYPTRIVQTRTLLPAPGEAMSESYPTIAERSNDTLHIFYEVDREGGSDILNDAGATNTQNPMIYLKTPVEYVLRDSLFVAAPFHFNGDHASEPQSVRDESSVTPSEFGLTSAFPNPFNNRSIIEFKLDRAQDIKLALYGLDGRQVKVIYSGNALRGSHKVTLNGEELPAGLYIVKLTGSETSSSLKLTLVK